MTLALNLEMIASSARVDSFLGRVIHQGPNWGITIYEFLLNKWVFGLACFWLGLFVYDRVYDYGRRLRREYGRMPLSWIRWRIRIVLSAMKRPWLGKRLNLARDLAALNSEITSPGIDYPALPSIDPADEDGMKRTAFYLRRILPEMRKDEIDGGRKLARAIIDRGLI